MRKTFTILFFLIIHFVYGQLYIKGKAHYKMFVTGYVGFSGSDCGDKIKGGLQHLVGFYEKNSSFHSFAQGSQPYPHMGNGLRSTSFGEGREITFQEDNKINKIEIITTRRDKDFFICDNSKHTKISFGIQDYCKNQDYQPQFLNQEVSFNLRIYPEVELSFENDNSNILGDDDYLIIPEFNGINKHFYQWEYNAGEGWVTLPIQYQHNNQLRIKGHEFLPPNKINEYIQLRVNMGCNKSNIITFFYKKSLPHIIKQSLSLTSCYNTNDGKITLYFDRDLVEEETLSFSITRNGQPYTLENRYRNIIRLDSNRTCTIENLPKGNYKLRMYGRNKGKDSYSPHGNTDYNFSIGNPPPVDFVFSKTDVYCNGGNDGSITVTASGGIGRGYEYKIDNNQWVAFPNNTKTTTIRGLSKGTYTLSVRDGNGCIARKQIVVMIFGIILGEIKNEKIIITEPQQPLSIIYTEQRNPTFHGASNGKIIAKIEGGTIFDNNSYLFEIKKDNVSLTSLATTEFSDGAFYIILDNITEGTYFFKVYDKNYSAAIQKEGCSILNSSITLSHPPALQATLSLEKPISCNRGNEFGNERDREMDGQRDESQDGILQIRAQGGTPFTGTANGGRPYKYTWKKQNPNGSWQLLPFEGDTAMNLSQGRYAINIEDANGIKLGRYNTHTNTLEALTDVVYELREPDPLTLSLEKTDATCRGNDGKITAVPSGGTPPYTYSWSNGATSSTIENLLPTSYFVEVTDHAGCTVQGSITLTQPNNLLITGNITPANCHNASNASINLTVAGGTAPYQYLWNTGATTANINNLSSGEYKVKITDREGCTYFKTFIIENPPIFQINLGGNRTLCNGQTLSLDATINDSEATYQWSSNNGFSSNAPQVILSQEGTYTVRVTNRNGCEATDTLTIERSNLQIAAEFLLTTQAYQNEEVILVNTSTPKGETTQWLVPEDRNIEIIQQDEGYISLIFKQKGEYRLGIKQTQGSCYKIFHKNILVEEARELPSSPPTHKAFVKEFEVAPNPSNGDFHAKVVLEKTGAIKFRLYSITGQLISQKAIPSAEEHWVDFQEHLSAGTYILVLETPYHVLSKKIIIIP